MNIKKKMEQNFYRAVTHRKNIVKCLVICNKTNNSSEDNGGRVGKAVQKRKTTGRAPFQEEQHAASKIRKGQNRQLTAQSKTNLKITQQERGKTGGALLMNSSHPPAFSIYKF